MADNDQSIYNLRYNQVTDGLEGFGGGTPQWTPLSVGGGGSGITQLTGDVTAGPGSGSQATTIANGAVTDAKINASAAIAFSKLAALTSTNILVGNGSNVPTAVALSGDATLSNAGVITLATVNSDVGSFTSANITVDATGRITAATNGSGAPSFTPLATVFSAQETDVTSASYSESPNISLNFAMANASHRVKVTICGDVKFVGVAGESAYMTLFVDHVDTCPDPAGFSGWLPGTTGPAVAPYSFSTIYTPGDTATHFYALAIKSDSASDTISCPYNAGCMIIEEII